MWEIIFSTIGALIYHLYMVAVIAFVALQFGYIRKPGQPDESSSKSSPPKEATNSIPDLNKLMGSLMQQLGPAMGEALSEKGAPKGEKPTLTFDDAQQAEEVQE